MAGGARRIILLGGLSAASAAVLALYAALFTALPTPYLLKRATALFARSGVSLEVASVEGTLGRGLTVSGLRLEAPGRWSLAVKRANVRVSLRALFLGRMTLDHILLDGAELKVRRPAGGAPSSATAPRASLSVVALEVRNGRVEVAQEGASPTEAAFGGWDSVEAEAALRLSGDGLQARVRTLSAVPRDPRLLPLRARGAMRWGWNRTLDFDAVVTAAGAEGLLRGELRRIGEKDAVGEARLLLSRFPLRAARGFWRAAPDRTASAELALTYAKGRLGWEGAVEVQGSGSASVKGSLRGDGEGVLCEGEASTARFVEGTPPLVPALEALRARYGGTARWSIHVVRGEPRAWSLLLSPAEAEIYGVPIRSGAVTLTGEGSAFVLKGSCASFVTGHASGRLDWEGAGKGWSAEAACDALDLRALLTPLGFWREPPSAVALPAGRFRVARVSLSRSPARFSLAAAGTEPAGAPVRFSLESSPDGVAWTVEAEGLDPGAYGAGSAGALTGRLAFSGPGADEGTFGLTLERWRLGEVSGGPVEAKLRLFQGGLSLEPCAVATSLGRATVGGTLARTGDLTARFDADGLDLGPPSRFLKVEGFSGVLDGRLQVERRGGRWRGAGRGSVARAGYAGWSAREVTFDGTWEPEGAAARVRWSGLGTADMPLGAGTLEVSGRPEAIELKLDGELGEGRRLAARASGALEAERGDLLLRGVSLRLEHAVFLQEGEARVRWEGERLGVEGLQLAGEGSHLRADLSLGFGENWRGLPLAGHLAARAVPVSLVPLPSSAGTLSGSVNADLRWTGTFLQPALTGSLDIEDGSYRFASSDLTYSPIRMRFAGEGDRLRLVEGRATTPEGGDAAAAGWVRFAGFVPEEFHLEVRGASLPFVVGRDMAGVCDVDVTLGGNFLHPVIGGAARVLKARIQLPDLERAGELPESIRFKNATPGSPFAGEARRHGSPVGRLRGEIRLEGGGGIWVSNRNLLAELQGSLAVRFVDLGVILQGTLSVVHGRYVLMGRKFELQDSRVFFTGADAQNVPALDVTALYRAKETDVLVRLQGSPRRPELTFTSRPPMEKADILAVLLYGRRLNDLSRDEKQSWSAAASALAVQYQAGPVLDAVRESLGLQALDLRVGGATGSPEVGLSAVIGDRTELEYRQVFGPVPEQRLDLRFRINRGLTFQTQASSDGKTGADLLWEYRY